MRYCYTKSILQIDPAQPAPLKRIMKRVDQINRYDSQQSLTVDTVLLSTKQCSTHLCKGHQKKGDTHTHTHTHTRARAHTHTHTHILLIIEHNVYVSPAILNADCNILFACTVGFLTFFHLHTETVHLPLLTKH